ncbi:hypothetical protein FB106_11271 [Synechococcus sp. Ace-Pa]|nr:hypothetical protein FB106_11271 [Synechococcus sp. Ace-Pa]
MALAIELNEEQSRALDELAGLLKVPKEVLVSAAVRDLLSRPSADFEAAASNLRAKKTRSSTVVWRDPLSPPRGGT